MEAGPGGVQSSQVGPAHQSDDWGKHCYECSRLSQLSAAAMLLLSACLLLAAGLVRTDIIDRKEEYDDYGYDDDFFYDEDYDETDNEVDVDGSSSSSEDSENSGDGEDDFVVVEAADDYDDYSEDYDENDKIFLSTQQSLNSLQALLSRIDLVDVYSSLTSSPSILKSFIKTCVEVGQ